MGANWPLTIGTVGPTPCWRKIAAHAAGRMHENEAVERTEQTDRTLSQCGRWHDPKLRTSIVTEAAAESWRKHAAQQKAVCAACCHSSRA